MEVTDPGMARHQRFLQNRNLKSGLVLQVTAYACGVGGLVLVFASGNVLLSLLGLAAIFAAPVIAQQSRRRRTKIITNVPAFYQYIDATQRPLILYLREFGSDPVSTPPHKNFTNNENWFDIFTTDEERIYAASKAYGLLVVVGKPGEHLPPGGGGHRIYINDDDWKQQVDELIRKASVIVYRCGRTDALRWELGRVIDHGKLRRTIFVSSDNESTTSVYQRVRELIGANALESSTKSVLEASERLRNSQNYHLVAHLDLDGVLAKSAVTARQLNALSAAFVTVLSSVFLIVDAEIEPIIKPLDEAISEAMSRIGQKTE